MKFPGELNKVGTQPPVTANALTKWWDKHGVRMIANLQATAKVPASEHFWDAEFLIKKYRLKGIDFGNWLSQEDRYNYLMMAGVAMYHLSHTILKCPAGHIGRGQLFLSFGSRGRGGSYAHYHSTDQYIQINRWPKTAGKRGKSYTKTLAAGKTHEAFAHEFGHAVDGKNMEYMSGGRSVIMGVRQPVLLKQLHQKWAARLEMERLFLVLFFKPNGEPTDWVKKFTALNEKEYWYRRTEIFARYFEALSALILEEQGIDPSFMCMVSEYGSVVYPPKALLKQSIPQFRAFCKAWSSEIK